VSDLTGADVAYCATFNNEQDVYYVRITPPAATFVANAFAFVTGIQLAGNTASLGQSDDDRLVGRPGIVLTSAIPPLQIEVIGQSPYQYPSEMTVQFEGNASTGGLEQKLFVRNYSTGQYDLVDTRPTTVPDQVVVVSPSGTAMNYVGPNREVKLLATYRATGPVLVYPWSAGIDQVQWSVRP
jgi:hypothetical protein